MQCFALTLSPRFYETDAQGHINNATIAAWFEVLRTGYLQGLMRGEGNGPVNWILASVHIDYLRETFFGEDVEMRVISTKVGNSSLSLDCEMGQGDKITVSGKAVLVYIDPDSRRPSRIPDALRAKMT